MLAKSLAKNQSIIMVARPRKRLFLALILVTLSLAALLAYVLWKVSFLGLSTISAYLPLIFGGMVITAVSIVAAGILGIALAIWGFPIQSFLLGIAWSAVNILFPLSIRIGRVFDIEKERIERSFIEVSNHLVRQKKLIVSPERLLVLTPHCIQNDSCPHKITRDVSNCRECGGCKVGELLQFSREYNVNLAVVTGGTLARKVVKLLRPKAVLAIACERDLTSGIQDIYPLPVIGVLNDRPEGPCCNTTVDTEVVKKTIKNFIGK